MHSFNLRKTNRFFSLNRADYWIFNFFIFILKQLKCHFQAWTLGETLCKIFPVIFYSNVAVSLLSMVGITLNRYLSPLTFIFFIINSNSLLFLPRYILIAHHHLYTRIYRPHIIALQLFLVWFLAFLTMVPPILGVWGTLGLDEQTFSCTILKKDGKSIKKFLFVVCFLLPCSVIITSYSCIYYTVRKQRQKLNKHICNSAGITSATASSKSMGLPAAREREDSRLTAMMLTIFICFVLCFLPLSIVNIFDDKHKYPWLNTVASILAWASSVINPFIYAASNRTYRVAYFKLFSAMKFWGEPLSPMPSKSFLPSKGSRDNGSNGNFNGKA